jgi:hypothetical protein
VHGGWRSARRRILPEVAAGPKLPPRWASLHLTEPNTHTRREGGWLEIVWPRASQGHSGQRRGHGASVTGIDSGSSPMANGWLGWVERPEVELWLWAIEEWCTTAEDLGMAMVFARWRRQRGEEGRGRASGNGKHRPRTQFFSFLMCRDIRCGAPRACGQATWRLESITSRPPKDFKLWTWRNWIPSRPNWQTNFDALEFPI